MTLEIVTPDGTEARQKLVFTEPELAEELRSNTRMIAQLRGLGAIEAIQLGNKFVYYLFFTHSISFAKQYEKKA